MKTITDIVAEFQEMWAHPLHRDTNAFTREAVNLRLKNVLTTLLSAAIERIEEKKKDESKDETFYEGDHSNSAFNEGCAQAIQVLSEMK